MDLEIVVLSGDGAPHLELLEALGGEAEGELVAAPLVLESVDAAEGLGDGDVEDEVGEGEEADGDPAMAALEPRRLDLGGEDKGQEEEEELEELPHLLLLQIYSSLLLEGLLEVELDDGIEGLDRRLLRD